jgi:DNA-binding XRE family transcriptional regulator
MSVKQPEQEVIILGATLQITLAAARVNAGFNQEQAAEKLGVSRQTIRNWEKGKVAPRVPEMYAISSVYNIPQENIFLPTNSTKSRA